MSWKASLHRHLGPDVGLGIPAGQECSSYGVCVVVVGRRTRSSSLIGFLGQGAMEISEEANQQNHLVTYDRQIEPPHMDAWTISHDASGGEHNPSIHHLENRERQ
ncbi:hypothetical protein CMEL01_02225 [Colletotrichum melonis]|uniref:Uncharacterized protein n=1 Tax=Colletotrichum melonis TaxID=1209925 RepID=A0AAI9ULB8_9PEZI|nr:hypothetical protein CMEL01_02225 [Colletotrichum melonis]